MGINYQVFGRKSNWTFHTHVHTHTHRHTQIYMHTYTHTFSYAIYVSDMQQTYITDKTVIGKNILRSLLWKRSLDSGNCMNLSENGDQCNSVKTKEFEVWSWISSFSSVTPAILIAFSWKTWIYFTRTMCCKFSYIK